MNFLCVKVLVYVLSAFASHLFYVITLTKYTQTITCNIRQVLSDIDIISILMMKVRVFILFARCTHSLTTLKMTLIRVILDKCFKGGILISTATTTLIQIYF